MRITKLTESKGYMAARQKMMMEAEADVYVSLDDDAWFLDPQAMAEAVRVMERDPKVAAVGFEILSPDCPQPSGRKGVEPAKMFIGCGHALRLKAVRELGGYEALPGYYGGEEKDLCLRFYDREWKVKRLNGSLIWHQKTPSLRDLKKQRESSVLNDLALISMRCPASLLIFSLGINFTNQLVFSLRNPAKWLFASLKGGAKFIAVLPMVFAKRRPVGTDVWIKYNTR